MIRKKKQPTKAIVLSQAPEIVISRKFDLWCAYYLDESNKKTYGNATQSALKVYDIAKKETAWSIGYENHRKLQVLASTIADLNGFGYFDRVKIAIKKALSGKYDDWHKLLVQIGDFKNKPQTLVQNNYDFSNLGADINKSLIERGLQPI